MKLEDNKSVPPAKSLAASALDESSLTAESAPPDSSVEPTTPAPDDT